ncbi:unnamed protein product, partial [Closterium sp. NIES-54]
GPAPSGVSQVDAVEPVEVAADFGESGGAEPECESTKGSDVRRFVATLEIYFEAIGCSTAQHDAARIRLAATLLRGPAL